MAPTLRLLSMNGGGAESVPYPNTFRGWPWPPSSEAMHPSSNVSRHVIPNRNSHALSISSLPAVSNCRQGQSLKGAELDGAFPIAICSCLRRLSMSQLQLARVVAPQQCHSSSYRACSCGLCRAGRCGDHGNSDCDSDDVAIPGVRIRAIGGAQRLNSFLSHRILTCPRFPTHAPHPLPTRLRSV